jgi:hypothetical protein
MSVTTRESIKNPKSKINNRFACLSLDEADNDLTRFLAYLVAAWWVLIKGVNVAVWENPRSNQPLDDF